MGREGRYWGSAETQDAAVLDLRTVLEKTAERGKVRGAFKTGQLGWAVRIWGSLKDPIPDREWQVCQNQG